MALDKNGAKNILRSKKQVDTEGKYSLKVTSTPRFYEGGEDQPDRYLISLAGIAPDQLKAAREYAAEEKYDEAAGMGLSFGQNCKFDGSAPDFLPEKGEIVDVEVEEVEAQDGSMVLRPTSISPRHAKRAQQVDVDSLFGEEEAEEATQGENFEEASS